MRKSIVFLFALASIAACDLTKLEPVQTKAFMKYFGDLGNTQGVDLIGLDDGYLLLGNNQNDIETALLLKVDLLGNTLWYQSIPNFRGRALAQSGSGYFVIGDGIDINNPTQMNLIKTSLQGDVITSVSLGNSGSAYHGSGLTISSDNEIVVSGYIEPLSGSADSTFLYGYDLDLAPAWTAVRKWGATGTQRVTSKSLIETESVTVPGEFNFVWTNLYTDGTTNTLEYYSVRRDEPTPGAGTELLSEYTLDAEIGDNSTSSVELSVVQTVLVNGFKGIAFTQADKNGTISPTLISPADKNYVAHAVLESRDGNYVVLGSTDDHGSDAARFDTDYFIKKVGFDGSDISDGFSLQFGGTGSESGTAIVQAAEDDGYVFIGTMRNTNDVEIMVLVKVNSKGELIN